MYHQLTTCSNIMVMFEKVTKKKAKQRERRGSGEGVGGGGSIWNPEGRNAQLPSESSRSLMYGGGGEGGGFNLESRRTKRTAPFRIVSILDVCVLLCLMIPFGADTLKKRPHQCFVWQLFCYLCSDFGRGKLRAFLSFR